MRSISAERAISATRRGRHTRAVPRAASGYQACVVAENIARGQGDIRSVMADWMTSPGHRANILNPQVTQYGFAGAGSVWVLVVARPC
jgi:uncharacterized protein YkwD